MTWVVDEVRTYSYNGTNGTDGAKQVEILEAGRYKLECWGARGANSREGYGVGASGGYACGELIIETLTTINIYVGGMPAQYSLVGGWNGGGSVLNDGYNGGGGGGASDIRIGGTDLSNRVIVGAGGGGGGARYATGTGGVGGGLVGGDAADYYSLIYIGGKGGTQSAGGNIGGTLGVGANGGNVGAGGGGGGYYGGGTATERMGGGGGSSYYGDLLNPYTEAGVWIGHGQVKITMLSGGGHTPITKKRKFAQII